VTTRALCLLVVTKPFVEHESDVLEKDMMNTGNQIYERGYL
jgi:hypothetical protein